MEGGPNIQERDVETSTSATEQNEPTEPEPVTGCLNLFCHPRGTMHRFIALIFMCFLGFGSYFCYDNPAALEDYLKKVLDITTSQYTMLYSFYSWPNVIMCFIGGFLVDRVFGIRLGTIIYMTITLVGQLVFATGVYTNLYWMMVSGRFIFGIGAESLAVAQNSYAVLWFKGKELNMVFGLQLSFARMGSTVNFLVMESIYDWVHQTFTGPHGLGIVLYIAMSTCLLSLFCALVLGGLDKRAERVLQRNEQTPNAEVARLQDVIHFRATFWLVTVVCVTYYVAVFPFISLAKEFFIEKFDMGKQEANSITSLVYLISGFASPVLGFIIDKTGKNILWISVAVSATILSHFLLGFTMLNPYVAMVILGLAYSTLASSLWPLVSLIIPEYQLGTAYGVCQSVQNLGLAVISIVTGQIVEKLGYTALEIFFLGSLILALLSTIGLWLLDKVRKDILNMTPNSRKEYHHNKEVAAELERQKLLLAASNTTIDYLGVDDDFRIRNSSPPTTAHI